VRMPVTACVVLSFFLVAALFMGLHTAFSAKDSTLRLKVQHGFRSAQLWVWIDSDQVYSGKLMGASRKKFGLIPDAVQGSLSETLPVSSGTHQIRIRVAAEDGSVQENTITGEFTPEGQRTLAVNARRSDLNLGWQSSTGVTADSAAPATANSVPPQGWVGRYAGTLLLTAAGSIISAITGFALKELPKQLARRPTAGN
jgi:hypothetical protein